jgi:hypothetical protein
VLRSNFVFSELDPCHRGLALPATSGNLALGVYPHPAEVLKSTSTFFPPRKNVRHSLLPCPLRARSKARKPIPFKGLLHGSLDTRGWGSLPRAHRLITPGFEGALACREDRRAASIPFRIISFADPPPSNPNRITFLQKT